MHKKQQPTLVCFSGEGLPRLTRYVPQPAGGFYSERFEIVDWRTFVQSLTRQTLERFRLGQLQGQGERPRRQRPGRARAALT